MATRAGASLPGADSEPVPDWRRHFQLPRYSLAAWAKSSPERCVLVSDVTGTSQVHCWDRTAGVLRQVTDKPGGVRHCAVEASGDHVWWFRDNSGGELGEWMRQPFHGGPNTPVMPGIAPFWPAGLAVGLGGHALVGRSTPEGTEIDLLTPDGSRTQVYRHQELAEAVDISRSLDLVVIAHSERGDLWQPGVRVLRPDGSTVTEVGRPDEALEVVGFAPVVGDSRLLLQRLVDDRWIPMIFDPLTGDRQDLQVDLAGDLDVDWFQDASALLVRNNHRARSALYRLDLSNGRLLSLDTPPGTISHTRTRPGGEVWYQWSSATCPPVFRGVREPMRFPAGAGMSAASVPVLDAWVPGREGDIHALISLPEGAAAPYPTMFLLHGGPDLCDEDAFSPEVAAWVEHGFAVVRVNYRGSTGYGDAWKAALRARVGLTELEDVAAVRRWVIEQGMADPARLVLAGWSWGGYLALLGLGTQPGDWTVGLAGTPIADCVAAYHAEMDEMKALDRTLFGGSPEEVPERYARSSPSSYVSAVRAPVLMCVGVNDPRCPVEQVESYAAELRVPHQVLKVQSGHNVTDVAARVAVVEAQLAFLASHLPAGSG